MPSFRYRAVDRTGIDVNGTLQARDPLDLERLLRDIGYWLIEAQPCRDSTSAAPPRIKNARRELIELFSAMAAMLDAGVPIIEAIETMAEESGNQVLRKVLRDLALNVKAGVGLGEALERHPQLFTRQMTHLVKAGEFSGNLPQSFHECARYLEWVDGLLAQLKQVSIYPAAVLTAVGLFVLLLFGFVVPTFAAILAELDRGLPLVTRLVLSAGDFVKSFWWLLLGVPIALALAVREGRNRSTAFELWVDQRLLALPVIGDIQRMVGLARFAHTMAMLLRAGVPVLQALGLTRDLAGNRVIADAIRQAEVAVSEGQNMTAAFARAELFSPMLQRMLVVGETTGTLDRSLAHVAQRFDQEIPRRIKRLISLLEPAIVLGLIALVGVVALAIFLPFMDLLGSLN